jgi:sugar O-acyltransferase (sialic acid O-acetyltransferase NeuD family)
MRLVIFGVSNMLGHILDCAIALQLEPSLIVMNVPEVIRPRTRSVHDRLKLLEKPPLVVMLKDFAPRDGECYFVGTTAPDRRQLVEDIERRFGIRCCNLVHPAAVVSPHASLATGVYISAHSSVGPGAEIGEQVYIGAKVHLAHDTIVEPYARILSGSNVAGHTRVGYGATIGMGATVIEELEVGREATVGAGAVVIEDVPMGAVVAGVPARILKPK